MDQLNQKPTVVRAVHYVSAGGANGTYPSTCRAGTVTEVDDDGDTVSVAVANPTGMHFDQHVPHDEENKSPKTWHWPIPCGK